MHSIERFSGPERLLICCSRNSTCWDDLRSPYPRRLRDEAKIQYSSICPYCERDCKKKGTDDRFSQLETLDHFYPESLFPEKYLDWPNLVYCCRRCNKRKGNRWPDAEEDETDWKLKDKYPAYVHVSTHVSPSMGYGNRPASEFFDYDLETGKIKPAEGLDPVDFSMAVRTIHDLDLNDCRLPNEVKKGQKDRLIYKRRLNKVENIKKKLTRKNAGAFAETRYAVLSMARPESPYSGITRAYLAYLSRYHPDIASLLAEEENLDRPVEGGCSGSGCA